MKKFISLFMFLRFFPNANLYLCKKTVNTKIKLSVPVCHSSESWNQVILKVFDIMNREVQRLVNEKLQPGSYEVTFTGSSLNRGVYFYKLITKDFSQTRRMVLIK